MHGPVFDPTTGGIELFQTPDAVAYADLIANGQRQTWAIRGKPFRGWLRRRHYQATGLALRPDQLRDKLDLLEARAQFDAPIRAVFTRIADHQGSIFLDLADQQWRAVEIGCDGWRMVTSPPVRFHRSAGMLPLPVPERGGSIRALTGLLNLAGTDDFTLVVAWLLAALRPRGPYPLLSITGEQGSAKTVLSKLLKSLIDPHVATARTPARDDRELMIAAKHNLVLAFDNVSTLTPWFSDALCRLATGASLAVRRLYTDDDEVLMQAARPVLLNGVEDVITRADLADRALFLELNAIDPTARRPEKAIWDSFAQIHPGVLGALLDAVVHGLRALPRTHLDQLPRMADFAHWIAACEGALWRQPRYLRAYAANRQSAIEAVIDGDAVAACVIQIMERTSRWSGTASDLLRTGTQHHRSVGASPRGWPSSPRAVSGRLRRSQTSLRGLGIEVAFRRGGRKGTRQIMITKQRHQRARS